MKQLAVIARGYSQYDDRLYDLLTKQLEKVRDEYDLDGPFEHMDFSGIMPCLVTAGATIEPAFENEGTEHEYVSSYRVIIEKEKTEQFYKELIIGLKYFNNFYQMA